MATLTVRDIDDEDYANLCRLAQSKNRSTAAQVREMIADATRHRTRSAGAVERLKAFRETTDWTRASDRNSTDILRDERASW